MKFKNNANSLFKNESISHHKEDDTLIHHNSLHESMHKTSFHEDIHNHDKIHESMHLGEDKIKNPFHNNFND